MTLMISSVNGLPVHPLIVHAVVVLVPLSLVGLLLIVVRTRWRRSLGWWVVLVAGGAAASAWLAKESGESLAMVIGRPIHHASLGSGLPYFVTAMFASIALFVGSSAVWDWRSRRRSQGASRTDGSVAGTARASGSDPGSIEELLGQTAAMVGTSETSTPLADPTTAPPADPGHAGQPQAGPQRMPVGLKVIAGFALVVAIATMVQTVRVGDSGTREVWGSVLEDAESASARSGQGTAENAAPATPVGTPVPSPTTAYTMADVARHNQATDCWTVIDDRVFDLTGWIARHPGGAAPIESLCGRNGSSNFSAQHQGQPRPTTQLDAFVIGVLQ